MIDELEAPAASAPRARRQHKMRWSFVAAGLAVAAAVAYLIFSSTTADAAYYLTINQLRACHDCSGRVVRIAGQVAAGSIQRNDMTEVIHFTIADTGSTLPVVYSGVVPDIFRPGVTVVVEGKLGAKGQFDAQTLLAKCPSKFQSATPGASSS
jgi:cytochrome c-type biogenesis protein CcmE